MSKRNSSESRMKALDLWQSPEGAGEPLVCLATSFTFDAAFFETECLGRFLQMDSHPQESDAVSYLLEREEKLASARVCVLVDRRHAQSKESLRWDVLPVIVPHAVQHAKIAVLCWANHLRVIIGSGNLTEAGYRKNLEVFGALDTSKASGGPVDEVLSSIDFLEQVVHRALGDESRPGPRRRAYEAVALLRRHVEDWPRSGTRTRRVATVFGGVGKPIFDQLHELLPGGPPRNVEVLSPFFDKDDRCAEMIPALGSILAKRRPRSIELTVPFEDLPDGTTRVFAPRGLVAAAEKLCAMSVNKVLHEQDAEIRPLHAKILTLANEGWALWLIGSSNFTRAGFGLKVEASNLEANLAYIARVIDSEARLLDQVWPDVSEEPVDLKSESIVWNPAFEEGEGEAVVALPAAFREALFDPACSPPRLILSFGENLPASWSIRATGGEEIINSSGWRNGAGDLTLEWEGRPVPFVLAVEWESKGGAHCADWPVNVVEPASLPAPEVLRDLTLDSLVEILGSTRPLHLAVAHALKKRARQQSTDIELDPHRRVNTETFLLRRTKRVALALERLRERLERPAFSVDALDWRLKGPVGPLALATAFRRDARTPTEARFFLAELGLTVGRVRIDRVAEGGLSSEIIRERIGVLIDEVENLASSLDGTDSPAIVGYVRDAFKAARRTCSHHSLDQI